MYKRKLPRILGLVLVALTGLALASFALAGNGGDGGKKHHGHHCKKWEKKCKPPVTTTTSTTPTTTTEPTTTTVPTTTETTPTPTPNPGEPSEGYCVQTSQYGNTFVQAGPDSFKPGGDWYALWKSNATVVVAGRIVTLQYEDGNGLILAALVPNVGLTCDQPYVDAFMHYANPGYGLRGDAWQAAFPGQTA